MGTLEGDFSFGNPMVQLLLGLEVCAEVVYWITLPIYLVERPGIHKTTVPNLIHGLDSLKIILAIRSHLHTDDRPPPDTILMMSRKVQDFVPEEFICPSALPTQIARSDLSTCDFLQILVGSQRGIES